MRNIENNLDNLGLVIQKHEEVFDKVINNQKEKNKVVPDETFITLMIFRKIAEKLDAIFILLENKSENAAKSICRDLIENILYFMYIIESKKMHKTRALSYYYSSLKDQVNLSKLLLSRNQRGKNIREFLNVNSDDELLVSKAQKAEDHFLSAIESEQYTNIKVEWDRFVKKGKSRYPNWYSLFKGPKNIRELSKHCGFEVDYDLLYGMYSQQVHSANAMQQFENVNGLAGIKNLRIYENPTVELMYSLKLGIISLNKVIDFFEMEEEINIEKWLKDFIK